MILHNEPLSQYTTWGIGGPAKLYYAPTSADDLVQFLKTLPNDEPIFFLGLGSNILIADEGFNGTVIHTLKMKGTIETISKTPHIVRADAGVPCAKLAKYCAKEELLTGAFFAGIPGTIGGALAMNAGAFGGETWAAVVKVEVINEKGQRYFRSPEEYTIAYRKVHLNNTSVNNTPDLREWFLAGYFQFEETAQETSDNKANKADKIDKTDKVDKIDDNIDTQEKIKRLLKKRSLSQPIGVRSCGSVFKNPPNDFAARLIESIGLKGRCIGQAQISPKHANFIINLGGAKASDILALIRLIEAEVFKHYGLRLETEVRMLGF